MDHLTPTQAKELRALLEEFADCFAENADALGRTDLTQHHIRLRDETPVKCAPRSIDPVRERFAQEEVQRMLKMGAIRPSESPWASPVVIVKKPGGKYRFCVDYRKLNGQTVIDAYPMPNTRDLLESLVGSAYYSTIDAQSGYWQVMMAPEDRYKTAFCIKGGLYEFDVMPFGLCNAPATFQRLMNKLLEGMEEGVGVYMDDILVRAATWALHLMYLRQVFTRIREGNIRLNLAKCHFGHSQLPFLGFIVSHEGIKPDPTKVQAMTDFPAPRNISTLRSFLGTTGFYRSFIQDYSKKAAPLNQLLKKDQPYAWSKAQQDAFDTIKAHMTTAPILAYPDFNRRFSLYTDASKQGLGAILGQKDAEGKREHVVLYISRSLTVPESHYGSSELECLGVVWAVLKLQRYLWHQEFDIYTDHQALTTLLGKQHTNSKFQRWCVLLGEF